MPNVVKSHEIDTSCNFQMYLASYKLLIFDLNRALVAGQVTFKQFRKVVANWDPAIPQTGIANTSVSTCPLQERQVLVSAVVNIRHLLHR